MCDKNFQQINHTLFCCSMIELKNTDLFLLTNFYLVSLLCIQQLFIENAKHIGILSEELMSQLDDDSELNHARRKKRRSGSLNRKHPIQTLLQLRIKKNVIRNTQTLTL